MLSPGKKNDLVEMEVKTATQPLWIPYASELTVKVVSYCVAWSD